jgi:hypothetical protein
MSDVRSPEIEFESDDFDFSSIEEELRVDERCQSLLSCFYRYLQNLGCSPQVASNLAYGADYFLRNYLLDFARQNVVRPKPGIVSYFAASWFITHTLAPEREVLDQHLEAVQEFYRYLKQQHYISADELAVIEEEAAQSEYYHQRIERFLAIVGDGFFAWDAECPVPFR